MQLYIEESLEPPTRSDLSKFENIHPNIWTQYNEAIASWFCTSHSIRKERTVLIRIKEILIFLEGKHLRYLDPSYRSIGSLLTKAYLSATKNANFSYQESSPGIQYKKTYGEQIKVDYCLDLNSSGQVFPILDESCIISLNSQNDSFKLPTLASNYSQAIVWINHKLQLLKM